MPTKKNTRARKGEKYTPQWVTEKGRITSHVSAIDAIRRRIEKARSE